MKVFYEKYFYDFKMFKKKQRIFRKKASEALDRLETHDSRSKIAETKTKISENSRENEAQNLPQMQSCLIKVCLDKIG